MDRTSLELTSATSHEWATHTSSKLHDGLLPHTDLVACGPALQLQTETVSRLFIVLDSLAQATIVILH